MRLFSSKKICITIAIVGALLAAALVGVAVMRAYASRQTFQEDGYILTLEQEEDQVAVSRQNRFSSGTSWSSSGLSSVTFRDEDGAHVTVDADSFIHYSSSSLAAMTDAAIADLDAYLDGVIGCYTIYAGDTLTWDGSVFTIASGDAQKTFENFVWKNSDSRYLLGSSTLTVTFADGTAAALETGFLELYYPEDDWKIVKLTDGEQAWQVVSEGCTVTLSDGVVLDCATGELLLPGQAETDEEDEDGSITTASVSSASGQVLTLSGIEIGSTEYVSLGTQTSRSMPSFRFTVYDGEDGAAGIDGENGAAGEDGADGDDGEDGAEGAVGEAGEDGAAGGAGSGGNTGMTGANGGTETGVDVATGQPEVLVDTWDFGSETDSEGISSLTLDFSLYYDEETYETIDPTQGNAYIYLYNVETGEVVWSESGQTITDDPDDAKYKVTGLASDTTYALAVVDSYTLNGTTYTTKVMERMFTTDTSGVTASLKSRTSNSFTVGVTAVDEDYTEITSVTVTLTGGGETITATYDADNTSIDLSDLVIGLLNGTTTTELESNTYYDITLTVDYTYTANSLVETKTFELGWTTLKETPTVEDLSLTSENGYLVAAATITDEDDALESVTYYLYDSDGELVDYQTSSGSAVYFHVDGTLIANHATYYLAIQYTYNDGSMAVTVDALDSNSTGIDENTDDILDGLLYTSAVAQTGTGVSISFSGSGTELYNLVSGDTSEGTTYEAIRGALTVELNGTRISVNDVRELTLLVTDGMTYEKTFTFTDCGGTQGDIEGSFSLPLDLDGLLINTTYALTLSGYVYDKTSDTYQEATIGTIALHTDSEAEIVIGMAADTSGAIGVTFWLGATESSVAANLTNLSGTDGYFAGTNASYRNLSSIVFELHTGEADAVSDENLVGTCEVYVQDEEGEKESFAYGYSLLYEYYYGENAFDSEVNGGTNSVGVGESFSYRFTYNYGTTKKTGEISTSDLSTLSTSGKYTIVVTECYDYTLDRYSYSGDDELYDYYLATQGLEMEDYVNELTVSGTTSSGTITYQSRPVSPTDVTKNGVALTVEELVNSAMGAYNGSSDNSAFDPALLDETGVGLEISSYFSDPEKYTRTMTIYGFTYTEFYDTDFWPSGSTLSEVGSNANFRFTFPMTSDGAEITDATEDDDYRSDMPQIYLLIYDSTDDELTAYLESNGYTSLNDYNSTNTSGAEDAGYAYRKYDAALDAWIIYVYSSFLSRGTTYVFAYDAVMEFGSGTDTTFYWPEQYYEEGWIAGSSYSKSSMLRSSFYQFEKQAPQAELLLTSSSYDETGTTYGTDEWQIYLYDPDEALVAESLLGYDADYDVVGTLYDASGSALLDQDNGQKIHIGWSDENSTEHTLLYASDTSTASSYYGMVYATVDSSTSSVLTDETARAAATAVLEDLVEAMRDVELNTNEEVDSAGTTVTFSYLYGNGVYYSWQAGYRLIDDYPSASMGLLPLAEHYYGGTADWTASGNTLSAASVTSSGTTTTYDYTIKTTVDESTNDTVTVALNTSNSSYPSTYLKNMYRIAGVQITAEYDDNGTWTQIVERDENGDPTTEPKVLWSSLTRSSSADPYSFTFNISDLDSTENGGDPQFSSGDSLRFTYTLYYDDGTRDVDNMGTSSDADYYALKSVNLQSSGYAYYMLLKSTEATSTPTYRTYATNSLYEVDKLAFSYTAVQSNAGTWYVTDMSQSYQVAGAPLNEELLSGLTDGYFTRTEDLNYGDDAQTGYATGNVAEFCALQTITFTAETEVSAIAPTLSSVEITAGLTQAQVDLTIGSYNLMEYPDGEYLHLYYAVYEETVTTDSGGNTSTTLTLVGVMIGEADQSSSIRTVLLEGLENEKTYRLYIYYKDNRDGNAKTDTEIFGTTTPGTFVTGTDAEALAKCFTPTTNSVLDPTSNETVSGNGSSIQKIMGGTSHTVTSAYYDDDGNYVAAVMDYYETFTTLNGIVIGNPKFSLGSTSSYFDSVTAPTASGKKLTASATTSYKQDENTEVYFVLERRASTSDDWKTVLAPEDYYTTAIKNAVTTEDEDAYCAQDGTISDVSMTHWEYYGNDYSYTDLTANTAGTTYTASMSLTYYPDGVIQPGYYYRMKIMIFQFDENGENPALVSLYSSSSSQRYTAITTEWKQYSYNSLNPLVKVTNTVRAQDSITVNIQGQSTYYTYLDRYYYLRLCKWDGTEWVVLEDTDSASKSVYGAVTYGSTSISDRCDKVAYLVGRTYSVSFQNLDYNTTYALRFYGLMDSDYDNYVNVADSSGTPLAENDETYGTIFTEIADGDYYDSSKSVTDPGARLSVLYKYYLGISSSDSASSLVIGDTYRDTNAATSVTWDAEQVLLCQSSSITTLADGVTATIGDHYQSDPLSSTSVMLYFENASGLDTVDHIGYTITYFGTGSVDPISGTIYKGSAASPMDGGGTEGNVTLTITNNLLNLNLAGTWYIQLELYDEDDERIEKPGTIEIDVD